MKWLKKLLNKKPAKQKEQIPESIRTNTKGRVCCICEQEIFDDDKYTKKMGNLFHRRCYKSGKSSSGIKF